MPYTLGARSLGNLQGVHPKLVEVVNRAITITKQDFAVTGGFTGTIVSEWEGHAYCAVDAFEQVRRHQAMCRRILAGEPVVAA